MLIDDKINRVQEQSQQEKRYANVRKDSMRKCACVLSQPGGTPAGAAPLRHHHLWAAARTAPRL